MAKEISDNRPELKNQETANLINDINAKLKKGEVTEAALSTDEKVLARVTDGIYRQPASALRELISNAYDADAENVEIQTDVPRFSNMIIRDDGNGMSVESLTNLIYHIGGSVKNNSSRRVTGITDNQDVTRSPLKKRKLIGKIGIGLFSVAQLTREFTIVTKQRDTDYYLIADVFLNNYSEQQLDEYEKRGSSFETGQVKIRTEHTENTLAHGTDIILKNIKKSAKDQLKSVEVWMQESSIESDEPETTKTKTLVDTPSFHIGCSHNIDDSEIFRDPSIPWSDNDEPKDKFAKLYSSIVQRAATTVAPRLETDLDNYLNMIWTLSLSVPIDYIEKHPFLLSGNDYPSVYKISNLPKGKAEEIALLPDESISEKFSLKTPVTSTGFNVRIDGIQLFRPIKFSNIPSTHAAVKKPILFIGAANPDLSKISKTDSGGDLAFEAYILWCPRVIPREHNGVILRIHNASGVLFDSNFMKYQVAEHVIKGQLTIEIFVRQGLDSALNIDRESFNISHPHYQIITRWLHEALRQVIGKYKEIKRSVTSDNKDQRNATFSGNLDRIVKDVSIVVQKDIDDIIPVNISEDNVQLNNSDSGTLFIKKSDFSSWSESSKSRSVSLQYTEQKTRAIIQVLGLFDLLDNLTQQRQSELFQAIVKVLSTEE